MSMLFNKVTSWSKTKKPEAAYVRHHPGSNSNSCLKLGMVRFEVMEQGTYSIWNWFPNHHWNILYFIYCLIQFFKPCNFRKIIKNEFSFTTLWDFWYVLEFLVAEILKVRFFLSKIPSHQFCFVFLIICQLKRRYTIQ